MKLASGPFSSEVDAYKAYIAARNREESPENILSSLHPCVSLVTKRKTEIGPFSVAERLFERAGWEPPSEPLSHVELLAERTNRSGLVTPYCCSFYIHNPARIQTETYIHLEDGWIRKIFIYSVWLDSHYPFPEQVIDVVARLRSKGVPLQSL